MFWPDTYALISLAGATIPASVGSYVWRRHRDKPGAKALAALTWVLALWGVAYALQLGGPDEALFYNIKAVILMVAAPLWLIFVLQYTGRDRQVKRGYLVLLAAVPIATPVSILTNQNPDLWFWLVSAYATFLVLAGATLLILVLIGSQNLYGKQSLCLLLGFSAPWAAYAVSVDPGVGLLSDPNSMIFAPATLAFAWGLYRYRLLDVYPVAHDVVVEGMSDGTLVLDTHGRISDLNPSAARILGCKPGEVVGKNFREVMNTKGKASLRGNRGIALLDHYEKQGQAREEIRLGEGDNAHHYDLALSALCDGRDRRTGHLVVLREVTEKKLATERLDRMAHYDALTGLPNRTLFYERLNQEVARKKRLSRGDGLLALMFLDLDRFKTINDTLGHDVGDLLLKETARRLKASVREYDVVARLAGDEFTVIMPEITDIGEVTEVANRIIGSIAEPFLLDGNELSVTTSVGICFHPKDGHDPATLVKNADAAMYRAKAGGKNRYEVFVEDVSQEEEQQAECFEPEDELNRAIEDDQFVLYYQPEIRMSTDHVVGVEALVRWEHPKRGLLQPKDFIPLAEETGLIFAIERWVLREACRRMHFWHERYPTEAPLTITVNISPRHFTHPNLAGVVSDILEETGLDPQGLILEIKENILHEDAASAAVPLQALKKLGVKLSLDDFDAVYSSLSQIIHTPLDVLKIDASLVRSFHEHEKDRKIVSAAISLGRTLGFRVIAKGVENPRQLVQLKGLGCEIAQGHYIAEPLPYRAASAFLATHLPTASDQQHDDRASDDRPPPSLPHPRATIPVPPARKRYNQWPSEKNG